MPYARRSYSTRSSRYRRYRRPTRKPARAGLVRRYFKKNYAVKYGRLMKDVMHLKRVINTEYKFIDQANQTGANYWNLIPGGTMSAGPGNPPATPGYVSQVINYPAVGDDQSDRDGRVIKLMSVQCKGVAACSGTSSTSGDMVIYIVMDKQAQAGETVDPVPWLFLQDSDGGYSIQSERNKDMLGRFAIVARKNVRLSGGSIGGVRKFNVYKKLSDHVRFDGTLAGDYIGKCLYVIMLTDKAVSTFSPNISLEFNTRLTWVDN